MLWAFIEFLTTRTIRFRFNQKRTNQRNINSWIQFNGIGGVNFIIIARIISSSSDLFLHAIEWTASKQNLILHTQNILFIKPSPMQLSAKEIIRKKKLKLTLTSYLIGLIVPICSVCNVTFGYCPMYTNANEAACCMNNILTWIFHKWNTFENHIHTITNTHTETDRQT